MRNDLKSRVENALVALRQGHMLILTDHDYREQEGDLILAADKVSPSAINFMTKYARGLIYLTLHEAIMDRLQILSCRHDIVPYIKQLFLYQSTQ
jgi:3,4-dihydroxy 2-butanone 4-phosphate synthase / GTP cyclohydrolase II